jgi:hypothetical protein
VVADNRYCDVGIPDQKRKHCDNDGKDEGHLRWCCQVHSLARSVKISSDESTLADCLAPDRSAFAAALVVFRSGFPKTSVCCGECAFERSSICDRSSFLKRFSDRSDLTKSSAADAFAKSPLFASKTFIRRSRSLAFFKRAVTSSEPDNTDTR